MGMTEPQDRLAREREEIAARVANFKATQEKFEREREEYFVTNAGERAAIRTFAPRAGAAALLVVRRRTGDDPSTSSPRTCVGATRSVIRGAAPQKAVIPAHAGIQYAAASRFNH
jgi:hypothetical protein